MKKTTVALICSLYAVSAQAEEGFVYGLSGTANGFYGYTDYAGKYNGLHKHSHTPVTAEIYSYAGYEFDEETSAVLNLDAAVSGGKEVRDYNHGEWGENLYGSLKSGYGELSAGQVYNAAYQLAVGAPSVGAFRVNNSPLTDFIANPAWQRRGHTTAYRTLNSTYLNTDADAPKISYTTPELWSTKAAFSYTPDSYSEAGLLNRYSRYDNRSSYAAGLYNYQDFGFLEMESSLGYAYNRKSGQEVSAGLSFYRKGWTLGGSYRQSFTSSSDYALNLPASDRNMPYFYDGYRRGKAFNLGLKYEIGPFETGLSYFASFADKTDDESKILAFVNRYEICKYLAVYAAAAYAEYTGGTGTADNNRGTAVICGAELNF